MREIVQRAQDGDLEAFGQLVDRFQDAVYGAAYALLGDFHDAQDLAQESLIRAWRRLGGLSDPDAFAGWLYQLTRNCCVDFLRRKEADTVSLSAGGMPVSTAPTASEALEKAEMRGAVLDAIRALSEPNRLATTLFYIAGYRVEEVAEFLAVPVGTIKRRLHDSRSMLKQRMVAMVKNELKGSRPGPEFRDSIVKNLDPIGAKPLAERYVLMWLVAMFEKRQHRCSLRRSASLPSLVEMGARRELIDRAPPPASVNYEDVLMKLKTMANLGTEVRDGVTDGNIELNVTGREAIVHIRFEECADDPWCEVTMERLEP